MALAVVKEVTEMTFMTSCNARGMERLVLVANGNVIYREHTGLLKIISIYLASMQRLVLCVTCDVEYICCIGNIGNYGDQAWIKIFFQWSPNFWKHVLKRNTENGRGQF